MTDGGRNARQARNLGVFRAAGRIDLINDALTVGEGADWFRFRVRGNRLRFGSIAFVDRNTAANQGGAGLPGTRVNVFSARNLRESPDRVQRFRRFPAQLVPQGIGFVGFRVLKPGIYFVRVSSRPAALAQELNYSLEIRGYESI
ncbi:MAG: hypothetical protein MUF49_26645 [Oculatellaceae cyanobacterium Prado106]|jgi:hypothetical protein|nr:hypothetical protein [Oculatellaceae cyanobacterium Prado106]